MKINEIFYSLQGEGRLVGTPSIFLRTAGCNLRCTYCDTTYAYEKGTQMTIREILDELKKYPCTQVCVTGGEPLVQKETPRLIDSLLKKNYTVCLETNGSCSIKRLAGKQSLILSLDIKCPSSGSHEQMDMTNITYLSQQDQLKFIIKNKEDYQYAKKILAKYKPCCPVFFQPVWGTDAQNLAAWILHDGLSVQLSLQLHKIIWGSQKGV
ncbi:MAG: radical SAM protein [Candidatus Thermoplasmatota archaeon]|nr:radical SAM protein [Candidatus Thermoplasmatota archaeon]